MSDSLYITATGSRSGKSVVSLGLMEMLLRKIKRVGYFRPLIPGGDRPGKQDHRIQLISSRFGLDIPYDRMYGFTTHEGRRVVAESGEGLLLEIIIRKYRELKDTCEFVLCEGTDAESAFAAFEFDINADISKNLGCPVLLVANAHQKSTQETLQSIELAWESLAEKGCKTVATIINRADPPRVQAIMGPLRKRALTGNQLVYAIPEEGYLGKPTVGEIAEVLGAEVLCGEDRLHRHAHNFTVAAMQLQNFLSRIEHGSLIITPGDRADIIVACLAAAASSSMESIAGILLTGGLKPEGPVWKLIQGFASMVPVLSVKENTYPTATIVDKIQATIEPGDERKITRALAVFEGNVDLRELSERVITTRTTVVTPKMFEYDLIQKARTGKKHIILPEGEEERILRASEILLRRSVVDITLLGNERGIREKINQLGLRLDGVQIIEPVRSDHWEEYARAYFELRKHRGVTLDNARDVMRDVSYFGTMMIRSGHGDGMVSGSVHSTADTVRPAFEIVKTKPGFSIVSSVFFMCLPERVLVYGDCAVNPNPDAGQLADIAVSSAQTAKAFGIEPVVAMLSYSTGASGRGADVDKVREATGMAREMARESFPGLKIEGPIQYDAAIDPGVAKTKMPQSEVAGRATVFIFPDLNTGNNTYKAVQRSSGAVAVGPVLQGLNHPVNDLSRGCTVTDIVNTVAITAIQAQG
ncbi:MAG: phosphate acetyltransferase [Deltaproteobacteria bacterium]|nr:phosphate acetyltransferase [Deltaproteobacteria bacterium]